MGENVCCPYLKVVDCEDTKEHKHLFCDYQCTIQRIVIDNDWVRVFCISEFKDCKYYPKEG